MEWGLPGPGHVTCDRAVTRAQYNNDYCTDIYAVNCRPKPLQRDRLMLHITQIIGQVVDQKLRGLEAFEFKFLYIETIYWLPITTVCTIAHNC